MEPKGYYDRTYTPVCISVQLIVIKLCYRVVSYSVCYTTSTR